MSYLPLLFSTIRTQLRSTLFPYTTLFRSEIGKELDLNESELEALRAASLLHDIGKIAVPESIISKPGKLTPEELDRKSTRLNSSHTVISYAVFCLKKKKSVTKIPITRTGK